MTQKKNLALNVVKPKKALTPEAASFIDGAATVAAASPAPAPASSAPGPAETYEKRVVVQLSAGLQYALKKAALEQGKTVSELIRECARAYERNPKWTPGDTV